MTTWRQRGCGNPHGCSNVESSIPERTSGVNRGFESHSDEPVNDLAHASARSSRGFEPRSGEPARDVAPD